MASSRTLTFVLLFLAVNRSQQEDDKVDCTYRTNCDTTSSSISTITCEKTFTGMPSKDCECEGPACKSGGGTGTVDVAGKNYGNVKQSQCSDWCTDQKEVAEAKCNFWKYTNLMGHPTTTTCYLMTDCAVDTTGIDCPKKHQDEDESIECVSDVIDETRCTDDTVNPTPNDPTCPGPITRIENQRTKHVQGWKCYKPDGKMRITSIDMYAENAVMPLGGFCKLDDNLGSCKKGPLQMNCVLDDPTKPETIKWKKAESSMDDSGVFDTTEQTKLTEITCQADPLKFTDQGLPQQQGRDIVCTQGGITEDDEGSGSGDAEFIIPAENDCLMLCDDFDVLSFFTDWDTAKDSNRGWYYKVSEVDMEPVKMENADVLDCWGKRL